MPDPLLLYGATGYTASLILEEAARAGLSPLLAARDTRKLACVAERWRLEARSATLSDSAALGRMLRGVSVLLNAAGPFVDTALPLIDACVRAGVHYLDISGEVAALEAASRRHAAARRQATMILPAVGFDVVPSDCLCLGVTRALPKTRTLRIGISGLSLLSRGSARTLSRELGAATLVRRRGALVEIAPGSLNHSFELAGGERPFTAVTWGDLVTAHHSTGVENIETYFEATPAVSATVQANRYLGPLFRLPPVRTMLEQQAEGWVTDPSSAERASRRVQIVVEGETASGQRHSLCATTPEAYTLTARTSVAIAKRVLAGDVEPGFQTPARLFGSDFIWQFTATGTGTVRGRSHVS
jgi:short subunit dehydrogenase-like uncharacterized protein